jgi:hypothetical protein
VTTEDPALAPNKAITFRCLAQLSIIIQDILSKTVSSAKETTTVINQQSHDELALRLARWETYLPEGVRWHPYSSTPVMLQPHIACL